MYMKIQKSMELYLIWGLILMLPLVRNHCFHFSSFVQSVPNFVAQSLQNWVKSVSMGAQRWKERGSESVKKKSPEKYRQMSQICSQTKVPQSDFFEVFRVPIPGWSPRRPQTGPKAQKHVKMDVLERIFNCFSSSISYSVEAFWKWFVQNLQMCLFPTLQSGVVRI